MPPIPARLGVVGGLVAYAPFLHYVIAGLRPRFAGRAHLVR